MPVTGPVYDKQDGEDLYLEFLAHLKHKNMAIANAEYLGRLNKPMAEYSKGSLDLLREACHKVAMAETYITW